MTVYGTDQALIGKAIEWIEAGYSPALVTVVKTWGSSPRPLGSMLLMREDGLHSGSVSGGCVEDDLIARFCRDELSSEFPTRVDYGVDRDEAARMGLPCGGRLELVVERLESAAPLKLLRNSIRDRQLTTRRVCLNTGEVSLHPATVATQFSCSEDYLSKVFGPRWVLLLIGAGHLSQYVARMALMLDYRVILCDPREAYEQGCDVEGVELVRVMPDDAVQQYADHPRCAVVTLSHDPKLDDLALLDALSSEAFYVGALGSRLNSARRRERLLRMGLETRQLDRLHAPAGLPIGSHSPAEIAVSIMAEITAERNVVAKALSKAAATV